MRAAFLALSLIAASAEAAEPGRQVPLQYLPSLSGDYFQIDSKATGTSYHIYVRLPADYAEQPAKRYPIVYLLDGDSTFPMLAPQHLFMTYDDRTPEVIVVGIAYGGFGSVNKRERDFGEGAPAFERFLAEELLPSTERRVQADPARRLLVGQSYGGSFVLWNALNRPDLFWGRIASNPSFRFHLDRFSRPPERGGKPAGMLAVVSGTANNPQGRTGAIEWVDRQSRGSAPWVVRRFDIEGGTHAADLGRAYRIALGWMMPPSENR
jgi:predicted alpha/beta superfamily hydrolase